MLVQALQGERKFWHSASSVDRVDRLDQNLDRDLVNESCSEAKFELNVSMVTFNPVIQLRLKSNEHY